MIYLDNNATTKPAEEVVQAMLPFLREDFGNPSSLHIAGQTARHAVEAARARVASLVGARPRDIVFTSGGTEADNLGILGALDAYPSRKHVVTTSVEHVAVHDLCVRLAVRGNRVTFVPVDRDGRLDVDALAAALDDETAIVAVMAVNNETGVLFPLNEIAAITSQRGVPLHVDAVQAAGRIELDVRTLPVASLALSAHKIHGPKGIGALYVAPGTRIRSQFVGGHQERDLRPGTENVAGIVGFGVAAGLAKERMPIDVPRICALRDRLERGILAGVPSAVVIASGSPRVCNTANIAFPGMEAEAILIGLSQRGLCASSGSACSSGALEPSHVLRAMNIETETAMGAIRFSLSRYTSESEIDEAVAVVSEVVQKLASIG